MPKNRTLKLAAGIAASFIGLAGAIIVLAHAKIVTPELATLMFVALSGLYVGFGFLVAVYVLIRRLE